MRSSFLAVALLLAVTAGAQAQPTLNFSVSQMYHGEIVHIRGTGFTPGGDLLSHLFRPDGTEYPETSMKANAKGELVHDITIVPPYFGTYELLIDDVKAKASASQRFLMVPPTFDKPVRSQVQRLPAAFDGVWTGTLTEQPAASPSPSPSRTLIALTDGRIGAVVGTIAYQGPGCGGELWLVSASADSIQLGEVIRYGENSCRSRALVTLTRGKDGSVSMLWRDVTGAGAARGTIRKRSE